MNNKHIELLKRELCPATGCTEPIAIAYGASVLRNKYKINPADIVEINLFLSLNIFKNAMGVGIPGTKLTGINIAFSLGLIAGNDADKLNVLSNIGASKIREAEDFLSNHKINIDIAKNTDKLYIEIQIKTSNNEYILVIDKSHTNISLLKSNDGILIETHGSQVEGKESYNIYTSIKEIFDFIKSTEIKDIYFLKEGIELNKTIALEGINNKYGHEVGRTIKNPETILENFDVKNLITSMTAAASDARMGGCTLPVMTNSGSGNQGISVSIPVIILAEYLETDEELLLRAIALSNLVAIHLKQNLGKLSALCGVTISGIGASCGMVYLKGGKIENIIFTIKNMIGNISGMICDGAKNSCALKVATVTEAAYNSMLLAMNDKFVTSLEGIIDEEIEKSIDNLIKIGTIGMEATDKVILDIMLSKS